MKAGETASMPIDLLITLPQEARRHFLCTLVAMARLKY